MFFVRFIKENFVYLLIIVALLIIDFVKIPYDIEMPGDIINLNNRIKIDGDLGNIKGSFNMASVGVAEGSIPYALLSFIIPDWDLVKQEERLLEGETIKDAQVRNALYLKQSKDAALMAALNEAGEEYDIKNRINNVIYIDKVADTSIKVGDNIVSVDGKKIDNVLEIADIIESKDIGTKIDIVVKRNKKEYNTYAKVVEIDKKKKFGFVSLTTFDIDYDREILIESKASESGPSGGLMMSLSIYSLLTNKDLTNGKKIVGTGTISNDGTVGEIGGVKYKLLGANKEKADIFLVPSGNYEEALKVKKDRKLKIKLVKVDTLKDAIKYLGGESHE